MALTKYTLGELLIRNTETNENTEYNATSVRGLVNSKGISNTKANIDGRDLKKFLVIRPGGFVFNHRVHDKLGLGYNTSNEVYLFTNDYVAFYIKPEIAGQVLLPDYLYMWFLRSEFDRYMLFKTYGSATLFFNWENMCELEITLPDVLVQQKYVAIYKAMIANQQSYERGLEDLKLTIDGMLDQIKTEAPQIPLGELLAEIDNRNSDKAQSLVYGVTMSKQFIPSVANLDGVDISKYKLVATDQIACNFMHVGRDKSLPLAINQTDDPIVVSPAYFVFEKASELCLPEYIVMWLSREESGRYCWFISDSSVRGGFSLEQFYSITIPVTSIDQQYALTSIYNSYITRKEINDKLKMQIKSICPILIKGSLEEE